MATKSFSKEIIIKDKKRTYAFLSALENAENKEKKKISISVPVNTIIDKEKIKKIFGE